MRLIGGKNRGRKLLVPDESFTRPTTDRIRESVFNILAHHPEVELQGSRVLDAFAGSGAMGLEALSRGASHITFVELEPKIIQALQLNIQGISSKGETTLVQGSIAKIPSTSQAVDLVFLDPPYGKGLEFSCLPILVKQGWVSGDTVFVYETSIKTDVTLFELPIDVIDERTYGGTKILFFRLIQQR